MNWGKKGLPHKGYYPVSIHDLGFNEYTHCEMCGTQIRYQHELTHNSGLVINVGCICAEKLCAEYNGRLTEELFKLRQKLLKKKKEVLTSMDGTVIVIRQLKKDTVYLINENNQWSFFIHQVNGDNLDSALANLYFSNEESTIDAILRIYSDEDWL